MPDREKVIKGLESLRDICNSKSNMAMGKGRVAWAGYANTADDALILLKEQEPVKPDSFMDGRVQRFACKKCGKHLLYAEWGRDNYCSKCGQAVKWNGTN